MNSTMGKKVFTMFFLPFLIIFVVLSMMTYNTILRYVNDLIQTEINGVAEINSIILEERIDSVRISVISAADILSNLDGNETHGRERADNILRSMLNNEFVYNAWMVFEPQAFDGKDHEHTADYPGAPSGRFMRSYVVEDGEIIIAPDMDETVIDDPYECVWYTEPRDTGLLYIDLDNEDENLWDYGTDGEYVYTLTVVMPVFRGRTVIGCIGADIVFTDLASNIYADFESTVAVFYSSGNIFYAPDFIYAEESIDTLGFTHTAQIHEAFEHRESLFLPDEYCIFTDVYALTFFQPVLIKNYSDSLLFLYVATPNSILTERIRPILTVIALTALFVLGIIMFLLTYVIQKISKPINQLTSAANAISQGDIETEIGYFSDADNEIGLLSQSLHRMVEQFRFHTMVVEQKQRESEISANIESFVTISAGKEETFIGLGALFCEYFNIYKATFVYKQDGLATAYPYVILENAASPVESKTNPYEFIYHEQVEALFEERDFIFMNEQVFISHNITWLEPQTNAVCFLPIKTDTLHGFIIFEDDKRMPFTEGIETNLTYVSLVLSRWLSDKKWYDEDMAPAETAEACEDNPPIDVFTSLRQIDNLDVEAALDAMGGMQEVYEKTIQIVARTMPENISKMDGYLSDGNIKDFGVIVHGVKGGLHNIGATLYGYMASRLEDAALSNDTDYCMGHYPAFRDTVTAFAGQVTAVLSAKQTVTKGSIGADAFLDIIAKVKSAAEVYNAVEARGILDALLVATYNEQSDQLVEQTKIALEEFNCEGALNNIIQLEEILHERN